MGVSRRQLLAGSISSLMLSACGGGGSSATGGDVEPTVAWSVVSRGQDGYPLSDVSFGNSVFVARGSDDWHVVRDVSQAISYSTDGRTWTATDIAGLANEARIAGLSYCNGQFMAVTTIGDLLASANGRDWSIVIAATPEVDYVTYPDNFWRVAYGGGQYVMVGNHHGTLGTACWLSSDGIHWSQAAETGLALSPSFNRLMFLNGDFFLVGGGVLARSADLGHSWAIQDVVIDGTKASVHQLTFGKGTWVVATEQGQVASSTNLVDWTVRKTVNMTDHFRSAEYLDGLFILFMANTALTSSEGIDWTESIIGRLGDAPNSVAFNGDKLIAVGTPGLTVNGTVS